jgi:hypothetical protein
MTPKIASAAFLALLSGCAVTPMIGDAVDLWREPQSYWHQSVDGLDIAFRLKPQAPDEAEEAQLEIFIRDLRGAAPLPLLNAGVKGTASMPNKPGHIHILELVELHREDEPGRYGMHLKFGMGGQWLASFTIESKDGRRWKAQFPFMVSGSAVPQWERKKNGAPR